MMLMLHDLAIAFFALLGLGAIGIVVAALIAYRRAGPAEYPDS